jgi:hypothetical protein
MNKVAFLEISAIPPLHVDFAVSFGIRASSAIGNSSACVIGFESQ